MFKNGLVPKSSYFGTMVQLVQESPTLHIRGCFLAACNVCPHYIALQILIFELTE